MNNSKQMTELCANMSNKKHTEKNNPRPPKLTAIQFTATGAFDSARSCTSTMR